ncbi:ATP-grasp domain-containing protein [Ancylobacter mangrovi]|uniref:ATP-grasp domain-containing protein n=1 Tax=Ancylobacter mangrovi TaxID=2972472 RepID=UPI0021613E5E|nr:ATP-grasp domain-containing protein [Ancylobacter mangrovi]MCS0505169.1 hypothetical protein [Ancylobacter mangrovi]
MIRLLEFEGKELLKKNGFAVPPGALHGAGAPVGAGPWVVKAQVLTGGRGKAGGIRFADTPDEIEALAAAIAGLTINGLRVQEIYVEQRVEVRREFYLAAMVDRDRGRPVILACAEGGMDIESVPRDKIVECTVDPLVGLRDYTVNAVVRGLGADASLAPALAAAVRRLYATLVAEDAELVEINPLIVDGAGNVVAADAKVILDEDAAFRHRDRKAVPDGTPFEMQARELEVIGIELDGDIAAMMNGAGMTMATLDQITAMGGSVRGLVELHGVMWRGAEHIAKVIDLMRTLKPRVLLFNVYFQFRSLDTIAEGIALAIGQAGGDMPPVVVRMRGVREPEARAILEKVDCFVTDDFATACEKAIALSKAAKEN